MGSSLEIIRWPSARLEELCEHEEALDELLRYESFGSIFEENLNVNLLKAISTDRYYSLIAYVLSEEYRRAKRERSFRSHVHPWKSLEVRGVLGAHPLTGDLCPLAEEERRETWKEDLLEFSYTLPGEAAKAAELFAAFDFRAKVNEGTIRRYNENSLFGKIQTSPSTYYASGELPVETAIQNLVLWQADIDRFSGDCLLQQFPPLCSEAARCVATSLRSRTSRPINSGLPGHLARFLASASEREEAVVYSFLV